MNYRHDFHAGNFADVFKHVVLTRILLYLARKETPFRIIDTHAGNGLYPLHGGAPARTQEWRCGIGRIDPATMPPDARTLIAPYLDLVGDACTGASPYPGSPAIAQAMTRSFDRLNFCEKHPAALAALKTAIGRDRRVSIVDRDGYMGLKAFVPPNEKRGLALLDPPFEEPDEFHRLGEALAGAHAKWRGGVLAAWFPIKNRRGVESLLTAVRRAGVAEALLIEFGIDTPRDGGPLTANGLLVVNPPYVLADEMRHLLPPLSAQLAAGSGAFWRIDDKVAQAR